MANQHNTKPQKVTAQAHRYLVLLLYWPLYLLMFLLQERIPAKAYTPIYCSLDDLIPFCEFFIVFYLLWFVFWIGMLAYTLFYEPPTFKKFMWYLILTFTVSLAIYAIYPNCQNLRPVEFPRENVFVRIVQFIYWIDTNTNVCPSMHVIAAIGTVFAAYDSRSFSSIEWKTVFVIVAFLICVSILFVKQHSVVDLVVALPITAIGYLLCFHRKIARKSGHDAGR